MRSEALISECGLFRYYLYRQWDDKLPLLAFVMLNPSTADATVNDATIKKCISFAIALGYGGIVVLNLYAYRATKPADLKRAGYPIGANTDTVIQLILPGVAATVCAWGANARQRPERAAQVLEIIRRHSAVYALRLLDDGVPEHPLYLPHTCKLIHL